MFWRKLKYLLSPAQRRAQERETAEELQSLEALAERGELHNLTRAVEEARAAWTFNWLEELYRDIQYALRTMRHNPGFTATAVISLALGIGANTAIFSLMDALLWRWLPVPNPRELVQMRIQSARGDPTESLSNAIIDAFDKRKDIFMGVAGFSQATFDVGPRDAVSRVPGAWVTGSYYETLQLTPMSGRLLDSTDDQPGARPVAVISYGYWQSQFSANPSAIGQSIALNGVPVTVVGVSPSGFEGANVGAVAEITVPTAALAQLEPGAAALLKPGNFWLRALARPRPGLTLEQAQTGVRVAWPSIAEYALSPGWSENQRHETKNSVFELAPGGTGYTYLRRRFQKPLEVLLAATALVLLIACANVASLLLARATARQKEISVRLSIGAGRGRIIRQLLTESTLLSLLGAALGVMLAWLTSDLLLRVSSGLVSGTAVVLDVAPNWHILGFACTIAMANGIIFGLAPAIQTTAVGGASRIIEQSRSTRSRMLTALVTLQAAIALLLLVGAGLFARTIENLLNVDPGFRREGVLVVDLDGQRQGYKGDALTEFYRGLLARVQALPGVASASLTSHTPMSGATWTEAVAPKGQPLPERENAIFIAAGPGFFGTMQTPLVLGREFDEHDGGAPNVAIVNQRFAARFFGNQNPVGQYLTATVTNPPSDLRIVGVAHDVLTNNLRGKPRAIVYVPYFQRAGGDSIVIRVAGSLSQTASAVRKELQPSFPGASVEVHALNEQVERTLVQEKLLTSVTTGFGVLGLVLACVGLYGLLSYTVVRQTRDIGIRMALGARRGSVLWLIVGRALRLVAMGAIVGVPIAWMLSRLVESMLFGLKRGDPLVIAGAVVLLVAAGLAAAYIPARQATRVDPMTALRVE